MTGLPLCGPDKRDARGTNEEPAQPSLLDNLRYDNTEAVDIDLLVNHSGAKYPGVPLIREDVLRLDVEMSNFLPAIFVEIR
ncbi:hypothetical protein ACMD2_17466 [Ananas comosus]|uniref:Uncharacterized protein n=1 Tax=Ananas comosus TaxID=4615 RepID=A0A199VY53_ANACO|nr:hypothetical protein ACMD2_17466 [Ananas comosus]